MGTAMGPPAIAVAAALERARRLASLGERRIIGIAGMPGSGKSTLAERVVAELSPAAVNVPMDGFHLARGELVRLGAVARKGAADTFDAAGFVTLLERLRRPAGEVVYAPRFDRSLEEPVAGSIPVPPALPLVVTEGNYLLVEEGSWAGVRELLDEAWYVEVDEEVRLTRLVERHAAFGKTPEAARRWALGSDQANAELVARTRSRADVIVLAD